MAWRQPWDVACPCCKAGKGRVCRSRVTHKSMQPKAHGVRWDLSLGLRKPQTASSGRAKGESDGE